MRDPAVRDPAVRRLQAGALAVALLCAGCVAVPLPDHGHLGGHLEITEEQRADLVVGQTTREDVLLAYGVPEYTVDGDRVFLYRWTTSRGYWAVYLYFTAAGDAIRTRHMLLMEFDASGRIARLGVVEPNCGWRPSYRSLRRVAPADAADEDDDEAEFHIEKLTDLEVAATWAAR